MATAVRAIAMWPADVPKTTTLRLRRIRVDWGLFESMRAQDRRAFWQWIEACFGLPAWKLDARRVDEFAVVERRK